MKNCCDFEEDIFLLLDYVENGVKDKSCLLKYQKHPVMMLHEGIAILYTVLCEKYQQKYSFPKLNVTSSGMVLLFDRACFPWQGFPYPYDHARLGLWLLRSAQNDHSRYVIAKSMLAFQQATLDHFGKALTGLFCQDKGPSAKLITQAIYDFLESFNEPFLSIYDFVDNYIGYHFFRRERTTVAVAASGCKSGMGLFLRDHVGIICYGPHLPPFESGQGFGLAGRHFNYCYTKNDDDSAHISYTCRTAAPHVRKTGFQYLEDSSEFVPWIQASCKFAYNEVSYKCSFILPLFLSKHVSKKMSFSFFGKGKYCRIFKGPCLRAGALDSYKGPAEKIIFEGEDSQEVFLNGFKGDFMEVISLSGDETFWGANFLIIFHPSFNTSFQFSIS
ncbi:Uncharacterized protein CLAVI_000762 [Candidatus Clavichlamydia salmonicola]|uniref:hypothetical protein n=1 Tax=Candidatus Clavichlamydia salmonicola TaxID=469812 RepID=UPI001891D791|nr:hypothetical protein [Candidatus Clavichlamydia salmonicola]MBF5051127.1 Uncharacterized protein [Candidatus Clavichlamydia salmonicola]